METQKVTGETDSIKQLVIRNSYEIEALLSLLEKKGILSRTEMIEEIRGLKK